MREAIAVLNMRWAMGFVILAMAPVPRSALAQNAPTSAATPGGVQCLTRTFLDATGKAQPLAIYVLTSEAGTYSARGFATSACGAMSLAAYRAEACRVSRLGNTAVQNRLTQVLGVSPKDLCDSANRAAQASASTGN